MGFHLERLAIKKRKSHYRNFFYKQSFITSANTLNKITILGGQNLDLTSS